MCVYKYIYIYIYLCATIHTPLTRLYALCRLKVVLHDSRGGAREARARVRAPGRMRARCWAPSSCRRPVSGAASGASVARRSTQLVARYIYIHIYTYVHTPSPPPAPPPPAPLPPPRIGGMSIWRVILRGLSRSQDACRNKIADSAFNKKRDERQDGERKRERARKSERRREHRGKCGGRARQPRKHHLTGCLWEVFPAFACAAAVTEEQRALPPEPQCRFGSRLGRAGDGARELLPWTAGPGVQKNPNVVWAKP